MARHFSNQAKRGGLTALTNGTNISVENTSSHTAFSFEIPAMAAVAA